MSEINDGGAAFPGGVNEIYAGLERGDPINPGMSLRDYFAAKAMPACLSDYAMYARINGWDDNWRLCVTTDAYAMADAMLKSRAAS